MEATLFRMPRCDICGQVTPRDTFAAHVARHRAIENNPNAVKCRLCGKYLSSERFLQKHLEGHDEPFKCQFCKRRCGTKERFEDHKQKCHVRCFKCDLCVLTFNNVMGMYKHRKEEHPDVPKLRCSYCSKVFKSSGLYGKHDFQCRKKR